MCLELLSHSSCVYRLSLLSYVCISSWGQSSRPVYLFYPAVFFTVYIYTHILYSLYGCVCWEICLFFPFITHEVAIFWGCLIKCAYKYGADWRAYWSIFPGHYFGHLKITVLSTESEDAYHSAVCSFLCQKVKEFGTWLQRMEIHCALVMLCNVHVWHLGNVKCAQEFVSLQGKFISTPLLVKGYINWYCHLQHR